MADSTLTAIRTKVRRLTRSPSEAQLTTPQIDEYINTFVLYDFPEHLRLFDLRQTLTFYTQPYVDTYETETVDTNDPLYNFKNLYISVHPPVYIAGFQSHYSQSREQFFRIYPKIQFIEQVGTGNGANVAFSGTLSTIPVLQNNVLFDSITTANTGTYVTDDGAGNLIDDTGTTAGTIDYVTGVYSFSFSSAPGSAAVVNAQTVPYVASRPAALLFYNNIFTLRPVPDQVYAVNLEVYVRPTALAAGNSPQIEQWWQYIAYGAALKVFQDRMDNEGVMSIMPEYTKQEELVLRKTLVENANERTASIYSEMVQWPWGWNNRGAF